MSAFRVGVRSTFLLLTVTLGSSRPTVVFAQSMTVPSPEDMRALQSDLKRRDCPGDPPGNLMSFDCSFTTKMRWIEFASSSLTDQALTGASFFGGIGYLLHRDPPEWGRGWGGAGRSIGTRYSQNLAKGSSTFLFSVVMQADTRNVSLASDPGFRHDGPPSTSGRIGHALFDWATVRHSRVDGNGHRWPNLPLWAGATVSGVVGNAFLPSGTATTKTAVITATSSLATALAASFYTEFSPELGRLLGGLFKRGRVQSPVRNATEGAQ